MGARHSLGIWEENITLINSHGLYNSEKAGVMCKFEPYQTSYGFLLWVLWRTVTLRYWECTVPDSKVHGANMWPIWVLSAPDEPHVGPMNLAIRGKAFWHQSVPVVVCCILSTDFLQPVIQGDSRHLPWEDVAFSKIQIHHGHLGTLGAGVLLGT